MTLILRHEMQEVSEICHVFESGENVKYALILRQFESSRHSVVKC